MSESPDGGSNRCPECEKTFAAHVSRGGRQGCCPHCGSKVRGKTRDADQGSLAQFETDGGQQREQAEEKDVDPYLQLTSGMSSGLLVSFNESTPHGSSTGELEVVRAHEDGSLDLKERHFSQFEDTYYRFGPDGNGGVELVELDDEGHGTGWTQVETIEVLGFDG